MADDPNLEEQVAPPRQMPFKTVTHAQPGPAAATPPPAAPASSGAPAASAAPSAPSAPAEPAAPRTVVLRRPTLRRPGEAPKAPISPLGTKPVILKPPVGGAAPAAQPLSMTDNIAKGIEISRNEAAKKVTSRISVSSATSPIPPVTDDTAPAASPISLAKPPAKPADAAATEKKVTSRISLESAFATQPEMPQAQPKTIKLKRPGEAAAPFTPATPAPAPAAETPAPAPLPEGMTPITDGGEPAPEEPLTRRKTIKVKRPGGGSTPSAPKLPTVRADGVPSESDNLQTLSNFTAGAKPVAGPDKVNPIFIVAAVLAIVFASLLIWALSSQTYGERGAAGDFALPKGPSISPPPWLKPFD